MFMLIRIQILDSAQENKDPDPGPKHFFYKIFRLYEQMQSCQKIFFL